MKTTTRFPSAPHPSVRKPTFASSSRRFAWAVLAVAALTACSDSETIQPTPAVTVAPAVAPPGVVGVAYSYAFSATGGDGSFTWSIASGSVPPGLSLTAAGALTGTPTTPGSSDFSVRVVSADQSTLANLRIDVVDPLEVTTSALPTGRTGTAYSGALAATGGTGSYSWSVTSGGLPAGMSLDQAGVLSGTPTVSDARDVTVQVESGHQIQSRVLSLQVFDPLEVATTELTDGIVGVAYSGTLDAAGGVSAPRWTLTDGELPDGLVMDSTGAISGTPASTETASFTARAESGEEHASRTFQLAVVDLLSITTTTLPYAATEAEYEYALGASGGTGSYDWSIASGALPSGVTLGETGVLEGTPTEPGSFSFSIQALSGSQTASRTLELEVVDQLTITTEALEDGVADTPYSQLLESVGGTGVVTWSLVSGSLPAGVDLAGDGTLSGTPSTTGEASFTVRAAAAEQEATKAFTIQVFAPLEISTAALADGVVDEAYSQTLSASGGSGETNWTLASGALPEGLTLGASGDISGVPVSVGTTTLEVMAQSGPQSATRELEIRILAPLILFTTPLPDGQVGIPYSENVVASGGTGSYTFQLLSGELPAGTGLAGETGTISGTPTEDRDFTFAIEVVSGTQTASGQYTVTIDPESCNLASLPDTDGDRLPDCAETNDGVFVTATQAGTDPSVADTDGDGIDDGDEVLGTLDGLDLPAMGTNPLQQNILIEYDWFDDAEGGSGHSHRPSASTIAKVAAAFADAPIPNPDGSTGIVAIQDYGQGGPFTGGSLIADPDGCIVGGVGGSEYSGHLSGNFGSDRLGYFHYSLMIHRYDATSTGDCAGASGSSGQAYYNDHRSIVSSSTWHNGGSGDQYVANTILHEVGHNLNLSHGGARNAQAGLNYKPNYNSVMNYRYQFSGVDTGCDVNADNYLDYSRGGRITLDESSVDEQAGVCGNVPIDWNQDGDDTDSGITLDLQEYDNGPGGGSDNGSSSDILEDYDDWANITLASSVAGAPLPGGVSTSKEVESCTSAPPEPGGR